MICLQKSAILLLCVTQECNAMRGRKFAMSLNSVNIEDGGTKVVSIEKSTTISIRIPKAEKEYYDLILKNLDNVDSFNQMVKISLKEKFGSLEEIIK